MEGELHELRELVAQLRVDNERLRQGQAAAVPGPSDQPFDPLLLVVILLLKG